MGAGAFVTGGFPPIVDHPFIPPGIVWRVFLKEHEFRKWCTASPVALHSIAVEKRLTELLTTEMKAAPYAPRTKASMIEEAKLKQLYTSRRAFDRAWRSAVTDSGAVAWSARGRRPRNHRNKLRR
jgi:hypothetical protein